MKSLQEIIIEKLKIRKSTTKYDIEELDTKIFDFIQHLDVTRY